MENRLHAKLFGEKKIIRTFCGLRHNCINFQYLHDFYQYNIEKKDSSKLLDNCKYLALAASRSESIIL